MEVKKEGTVSEETAEELRMELSECREDERSAQNQIVQVISTAGTVLSVIFGVSSYLKEIDASMAQMRHYLFYLSSLVLILTLSYITALGMRNVLRFHYIRDLEDRLYCINRNDMVHWMSFSSPITTRNPLHLKNGYSIFHYLSYAIATVCAISFCLVIQYVQYISIKPHDMVDKAVIFVLGAIAVLDCGAFVIMSVKAQKMFCWAARVSRERRRKRVLGGETKLQLKDKIQIFLYYLYPKKKDFQKSFIIGIGFATGIFLFYDAHMTWQMWNPFFLSFFVIEFLVYQARYLWNDVRGIGDIRKGEKGRLPVHCLGERRAGLAAFFIVFTRIIAAGFIVIQFGGEIAVPLAVSMSVILVISAMYEAGRTKKWDRMVFFLVSLGYPVRFFSGLWASCPDFWNRKAEAAGSTNMNILLFLLFLSYMCLGEFSAVLPWAHEAFTQKRGGERITKSYCNTLIEKMSQHRECTVSTDILFPMREEGKLSDVWNISFLLGIFFLTMMTVLLKRDDFLWLLEISILFCTMKLCVSGHGKILAYTILSIVLLSAKTVLCAASDAVLCIYVCVTEAVFILLYFSLRYLFDPSFDFFHLLRSSAVWAGSKIRRAGSKILYLFAGRDLQDHTGK